MCSDMQIAMLYWIKNDGTTEEVSRHKTLTAEEVANDYGIPTKMFRAYVNQEIAEQDSCTALPFTLLLVVAYCLVVIAHDDAPAVNAVEDSIGFDIAENANFAWTGDYMGFKGVFDINSILDFWSWMGMGFVPLVWQQGFGSSSAANTTVWEMMQAAPEMYGRNHSQRGMYLGYNRVVGGVRLSQERHEPEEPCVTLEALIPVVEMGCVHGQKYETEPEMLDARSTADEIRTRTTWLWIHDDIEEVQRQVMKLEASEWIDKKTQKVEIALPVYNAEYGLHAIIHVNFFFSRGGHIWKLIIPMSVWADWHDYMYKLVYDGIWLACLLWIMASEGIEVIHIIRMKGLFSLYSEYINFWNAVDWASVFSAVAILIMFHFQLVLVDEMNAEAVALGNLSENLDRDAFQAKAKSYMMSVESAVHYCHKFRLVMAAYPLIIVFRLFKSFSAQPRLAVVTRSLQLASVDLIHFLIVFLSIIGVYAISAVTLFGRADDDFVTINRSLNSILLYMMGVFDWELIIIVGRLEGGFWFVTFMIMVSMLLLNMLLAIVMDAYSEVKATVGSAETLGQEAMQVYLRSRGERKGTLIPLEKVQKEVKQCMNRMKRWRAEEAEKKLEKLTVKEASTVRTFTATGALVVDEKEEVVEDSDESEDELGYLTVQKLLDIVPGMRYAQAMRLLGRSVSDWYETVKESADEEELRKHLQEAVHLQENLEAVTMEGGGGQHLSPSAREGDQLVDETKHIRRKVVKVWSELHKKEGATEWTAQAPALPKSLGNDQEKEGKVVSFNKHVEVKSAECTSIADTDATEHTHVLDDLEEVLNFCRAAGIDSTFDALRCSCLGRAVEILDVDYEDRTVLCHVDGVADIWLAAECLIPIPDGLGIVPPATSKSEWQARVDELEGEVIDCRGAIQEFFAAISDLQWRMRTARDERFEAEAATQDLRQKAQQLARENRVLKARLPRREAKILEAEEACTEEFDFVLKLTEQKRDLLRGYRAIENAPKEGGVRAVGDNGAPQPRRLSIS